LFDISSDTAIFLGFEADTAVKVNIATDFKNSSVQGKVLCLIGMGNIGKSTAF